MEDDSDGSARPATVDRARFGSEGLTNVSIAPKINKSHNCRVIVRLRPPVPSIIEKNDPRVASPRQTPLEKGCIRWDDIRHTLIVVQAHSQSYQFDKVFCPEATQEEIFHDCCAPLIDEFFEGYNCCVFAYGQTGAGKTFTMGSGAPTTQSLSEENDGIIPRAAHVEQGFAVQLSVIFLEIYKEDLRDLLDVDCHTTGHRGAPGKQIRITEDPLTKSISVVGCKSITVASPEELLACLTRGALNRMTASNRLNHSSSRSHAVFSITMNRKTKEGSVTAKFNFIDLAGSERIKRTRADGHRLKEGISINSGLLALSNVINALTLETHQSVPLARDPATCGTATAQPAGNVNHVPYRDSKLTRILQVGKSRRPQSPTDSLGGNSRTAMIACLSIAEEDFFESYNTIKYAARARNIQNIPIVNRDPHIALVEAYQRQIYDLTLQLRTLRRRQTERIIRGVENGYAHVTYLGSQTVYNEGGANLTLPSSTDPTTTSDTQSRNINALQQLEVEKQRQKELRVVYKELERRLHFHRESLSVTDERHNVQTPESVFLIDQEQTTVSTDINLNCRSSFSPFTESKKKEAGPSENMSVNCVDASVMKRTETIPMLSPPKSPLRCQHEEWKIETPMRKLSALLKEDTAQAPEVSNPCAVTSTSSSLNPSRSRGCQAYGTLESNNVTNLTDCNPRPTSEPLSTCNSEPFDETSESAQKLREQYEALNINIGRTDSLLKGAKSEQAHYISLVTNMRLQIAELTDLLSFSTQQKETLKLSISGASESIAVGHQKQQNLLARYKEEVKKVKEFETRLLRLTRQLDRVSKRKHDFEREIDTLQRTLKSLRLERQKTRKTLQEQGTRFQLLLAKKQTMIDHMKRKEARLLTETRKKEHIRRKQVDELQKERDALIRKFKGFQPFAQSVPSQPGALVSHRLTVASSAADNDHNGLGNFRKSTFFKKTEPRVHNFLTQQLTDALILGFSDICKHMTNQRATAQGQRSYPSVPIRHASSLPPNLSGSFSSHPSPWLSTSVIACAKTSNLLCYFVHWANARWTDSSRPEHKRRATEATGSSDVMGRRLALSPSQFPNELVISSLELQILFDFVYSIICGGITFYQPAKGSSWKKKPKFFTTKRPIGPICISTVKKLAKKDLRGPSTSICNPSLSNISDVQRSGTEIYKRSKPQQSLSTEPCDETHSDSEWEFVSDQEESHRSVDFSETELHLTSFKQFQHRKKTLLTSLNLQAARKKLRLQARLLALQQERVETLQKHLDTYKNNGFLPAPLMIFSEAPKNPNRIRLKRSGKLPNLCPSSFCDSGIRPASTSINSSQPNDPHDLSLICPSKADKSPTSVPYALPLSDTPALRPITTRRRVAPDDNMNPNIFPQPKRPHRTDSPLSRSSLRHSLKTSEPSSNCRFSAGLPNVLCAHAATDDDNNPLDLYRESISLQNPTLDQSLQPDAERPMYKTQMFKKQSDPPSGTTSFDDSVFSPSGVESSTSEVPFSLPCTSKSYECLSELRLRSNTLDTYLMDPLCVPVDHEDLSTMDGLDSGTYLEVEQQQANVGQAVDDAPLDCFIDATCHQKQEFLLTTHHNSTHLWDVARLFSKPSAPCGSSALTYFLSLPPAVIRRGVALESGKLYYISLGDHLGMFDIRAKGLCLEWPYASGSSSVITSQQSSALVRSIAKVSGRNDDTLASNWSVAACGDDSALRLYDLRNGGAQPLCKVATSSPAQTVLTYGHPRADNRPFNHHRSPLFGIATGGTDGVPRVWMNGWCILTPHHHSPITSLATLPVSGSASPFLISASLDGRIFLWDALAGTHPSHIGPASSQSYPKLARSLHASASVQLHSPIHCMATPTGVESVSSERPQLSVGLSNGRIAFLKTAEWNDKSQSSFSTDDDSGISAPLTPEPSYSRSSPSVSLQLFQIQDTHGIHSTSVHTLPVSSPESTGCSPAVTHLAMRPTYTISTLRNSPTVFFHRILMRNLAE